MTPNCHISERLKASCDRCGEWPSQLHMPEDLHGWYCAGCCPACNAQPKRQEQPARQDARPAQQNSSGQELHAA